MRDEDYNKFVSFDKINLFQFFIMYYVITSLMILKDELNDLDNEFNITYFEKKYNL